MLNAWKASTGLKNPTKASRVCSLHFSKNSFVPTTSAGNSTRKRKRLYFEAVPLQFTINHGDTINETNKPDEIEKADCERDNKTEPEIKRYVHF